MSHVNGGIRVVSAAVVACLICFAIAHGKKPDTPGGGGGGGDTDTLTNPAIVYVADDVSVTIANADGTATENLTGKGKAPRRRSPVWSPDGSMIAFLEEPDPGVFDLYIMNPDGSGRALAHQFQVGVERYTGLEWLPGGYFLFTSSTGPAVLNLSEGTVQSLGLEAIHDGPVYISSIGSSVDPTVPGSMGVIAYSTAGDIHLAMIDVGPSGGLTVDSTTIVRLKRTGLQGFPVVSPDGLWIAFYDDSHLDGGDTLSVVAIDYGNSLEFGSVTTLLEGGLGEFRVRPAWSPDSQWIAFTWAPDINPKRPDPYEIARISRSGAFRNMTNSSRHEVYVNWNPLWDDPAP